MTTTTKMCVELNEALMPIGGPRPWGDVLETMASLECRRGSGIVFDIMDRADITRIYFVYRYGTDPVFAVRDSARDERTYYLPLSVLLLGSWLGQLDDSNNSFDN